MTLAKITKQTVMALQRTMQDQKEEVSITERHARLESQKRAAHLHRYRKDGCTNSCESPQNYCRAERTSEESPETQLMRHVQTPDEHRRKGYYGANIICRDFSEANYSNQKPVRESRKYDSPQQSYRGAETTRRLIPEANHPKYNLDSQARNGTDLCNTTSKGTCHSDKNNNCLQYNETVTLGRISNKSPVSTIDMMPQWVLKGPTIPNASNKASFGLLDKWCNTLESYKPYTCGVWKSESLSMSTSNDSSASTKLDDDSSAMTKSSDVSSLLTKQRDESSVLAILSDNSTLSTKLSNNSSVFERLSDDSSISAKQSDDSSISATLSDYSSVLAMLSDNSSVLTNPSDFSSIPTTPSDDSSLLANLSCISQTSRTISSTEPDLASDKFAEFEHDINFLSKCSNMTSSPNSRPLGERCRPSPQNSFVSGTSRSELERSLRETVDISLPEPDVITEAMFSTICPKQSLNRSPFPISPLAKPVNRPDIDVQNKLTRMSPYLKLQNRDDSPLSRWSQSSKSNEPGPEKYHDDVAKDTSAPGSVFSSPVRRCLAFDKPHTQPELMPETDANWNQPVAVTTPKKSEPVRRFRNEDEEAVYYLITKYLQNEDGGYA